MEIIPVVNKIDLPSADVERVKKEVENVIGLDMSEAVPVSAKTGLNVENVLERIVELVPPPEDRSDKPLRCLILIPSLILTKVLLLMSVLWMGKSGQVWK